MNYIDRETHEHPLTPVQIIAANPTTCYPVPFEPCDRYAAVQPTPHPDYDPDTQRLIEGAPLEVPAEGAESAEPAPGLPAVVDPGVTPYTKPLFDAPPPVESPATAAAPLPVGVAPAPEPLPAPVQSLSTWVQTWEVVALSADEIAAALDSGRAALAQQATARRYDIETGGITLPDGTRIDTARVDQDAITRVLVNADAAGVETINFKASSGWVQLTIAQLRGIASAVALHVQACYDAERAHHEAIALLETAAAVRGYDLAAGWPQ